MFYFLIGLFHYYSLFAFLFPLQAQAVTLTVAQAFKIALDLWEIAQEGEFTKQRGDDAGSNT